MSKRIILVLASFPVLSETFIVNKFVGLVDKGWDVHVVCNRFDHKAAASFPQLANNREMIFRIHQAWPVNPRALTILLFPLVLFMCMIKNPVSLINYISLGLKTHGIRILKRCYLDWQIIALKPDLVHFEFGTLALDRADINYLLGCKEVVSFRGYDLNFSGLDQPDYYHDVWTHADGIHFLGEDLHQRALRRGFPPSKPYALIPPAIDTKFFSPNDELDAEASGTAERPLRILSVGRLAWKKGYEYAIQAVKILREQNIFCEYHIIGGGDYIVPMLTFTRYQLALEDIIAFLGAQPRERVREELEWADVFLHAAISEGFCNAVLEAQSMQVPAVTSDADGLPENVADGVTGFVVPRRDPAALAEKVAALAADPDLRLRMGKAGRERVLRHFQLHDQIQKFADFYSIILNHEQN